MSIIFVTLYNKDNKIVTIEDFVLSFPIDDNLSNI
jgi:hypothetical protein